MHGLPTEFVEMTDACLIVDGASLPVHRAILAANSTVFAKLFNCATTKKPMPAPEPSALRLAQVSGNCQTSNTTQLQVPLKGDNIWDVCTALIYLYKGLVFSSSPSEITSSADARALVKFAHKYDIKSMLEACESYLIELVNKDMASCTAENYRLFLTNEDVVSWTALAEEYNLDNLLAHCELFITQDNDSQFVVRSCHDC